MTFVCNLCLLPCSLHFLMLRQYYAICHFEETNGLTKLRVRRHRNLCDIENASQHTYVLLCAMQLLKLVTDVIKALN